MLRVGSMMSPSLLIKEDRVRLVLGSGGSKRIRSAIVQVISNVLDHNMALSDALAAPRLHWENDQLQLEPGFDANGIERLRQALALPVNTWAETSMYFGGVHTVAPGDADTVHAVGDPRRGGNAIVIG